MAFISVTNKPLRSISNRYAGNYHAFLTLACVAWRFNLSTLVTRGNCLNRQATQAISPTSRPGEEQRPDCMERAAEIKPNKPTAC